jgi:EmrB/QacA subfamily drug resistance transporter
MPDRVHTPSPSGSGGAPPRARRGATVAALLLAMFMAAMEMTVVSTAMPTVVAELGGAGHYAWVFSAYMLTSTVTVPVYGKLADLYGRKPVLLASMALFLLGSMASGQARTMTQLIVFRAVQGLGAGGMQPMALTVVGDIFDIEERARMQGLFGAVWAIAGLVGPLLGGILVATLSWRWVFYVNVPFGIVSALVLVFSLVESIEPRQHKLDIAGALLLSAAVLSLLLGSDGLFPWVLLPGSAVLTALFVAVERRATEPILPVDLFSQRVLATSSALSAISGGAMIGLVTFVPLYAQGVLGATPTEAGTTIATMAVAWPVASALSGRLIPRIGFRRLVRFGMAVVGASAVGLAWLTTSATGLTELRIVSAVFGVGMGLGNTALVIAVQTSVGFSQRGVATASTVFFRNIGGTVGVGVMGVVLAGVLRARTPPGHEDGAELVARILGPERHDVAPEILRGIATDLASGVHEVTRIIAGLAVLAALVAWVFPAVSTRVVPSPAKRAAP